MARQRRGRGSDAELQELRRRAREGGGPADVMALHQQLARVGQDGDHYGQLLLEDFQDDVSVRGIRIGVRHPNFDDGTAGSIFVPDPFGRPDGIILSATLTSEQRSWGLGGYQEGARQRKEAEASGREPPCDSTIWVQAALTHPRPGANVRETGDQAAQSYPHPFYYWITNQMAITGNQLFEGKTPVRFEREYLLLREYQRAPQSMVQQAAKAYHELVRFLTKSHITHELESLRQRLGGKLTFEGVTGMVAGWGWGPGAERFRRVVQNVFGRAAISALQAVKPPPLPGVGLGSGSSPLNASGAGWGYWAIMALARHLSGNRAIVTPYILRNPFSREAITETSISFTSRQARNTNNPGTVTVSFDPVMGLWSGLGDSYSGNEIPSGGLWDIDSRSSPSTVQNLAEDAHHWIVDRFPDAVIRVREDWAQGGYVQIYPRI